jgi:hypothetical protein
METRTANISGKKTGTTTATYVEVLDIDTRGYGAQGKTLIIINNISASKDMHYKIDGYPSSNSTYFVAIKAETDMQEATQVASTDVDKGYARVVVSLQDGESGAACPYEVDYTTY